MVDTAVSHPMIELRNLHRYFDKTKAVEGISFSVAKGQVFGYIGPNGAGKTTSMRILATLDDPTMGDAFVDGFSVIDDPDRVRSRLGFMPDYFNAYANVNVYEYLDFFARAYQIDRRRRADAIDRVMQFTGLHVLAEKPTDGLSKGMKQRLCLGRALIHDPAVLVLDEPAAGLDPRARIELREMIRALAVEGKTVLISSHILSELAEMCDIVGIIERGRLLAVGSVEEIHGRHAAAERVVAVRLLADMARCRLWLEARTGIDTVRTHGNQIWFTHGGGETDEVEILKALIADGFGVAAFAAQRQSLEEVFLQVTKGLVQ